RATALKKDDINGKAHTAYVFNNPKVNDLLGFDKVRDYFFTPTVPRGWRHVVETLPVIANQPAGNQPVQPNQQYGSPAQPQNNEIQLYSPK
ncbi:MAG: hypothetical protein FWE67_09445, partial [Planctomycetaceae bacterium]|nr:hypothetical protein [Planctomycetaceae bacterium]